jgi:hypothetical protein
MKLSALLAAFFLLAQCAPAQQSHLSACRKAANATVTAQIDTNTGQFCVMAADGTPLLFSGGAAFTSYSSVYLDGQLFTNNNTLSAIKPRNALPMPHVQAWTRPDCVGFDVTVTRQHARLAVTQTLYPRAEGDYGFIRVVTVLRNLSAVPVQAGMQLMYDLAIGPSDLVAVTVRNTLVPLETGWQGSAVPPDFFGKGKGSPYRVRGRLQHDTLTPPDRFIVGKWSYNGYLGAAQWDYAAENGRAFWDNAALLQWDDAPLAPGATRTIVTDYGLEITSGRSLALACSTDSLYLRRLVPPETFHYFALSAGVQNTALTGAADTVDLEIKLPAGVRLAAGLPAVKQLVVPPGATRSTAWGCEADSSVAFLTWRIPIEVRSRSGIVGVCEKTVMVPGRPLSLVCSASSVSIDTAGGGYSPNPVAVFAKVRNTTTAPLAGLRCTLTPKNWGATLLGPATVPVLPDPVPPGDEGIATWLVQVPVSISPQSHQYAVILSGVGAQCNGSIETPGIKPSFASCAGQHTTLGTDFWIAWPEPYGTNAGAGVSGPRVLVVAQERTNVRIEYTATGHRIDTTLGAWEQGVFSMDWGLENHQPEVVSRQTVHVTSDRPISLTASIDGWMVIDATTVLPAVALGKRYMMLANDPAMRLANKNSNAETDEILIVATEDGTTVTVTPTDTTGSGKLPGSPFVTTLQRGELLPVFGKGSFRNALFGSSIVADKPVAVFAASKISWILTHPAGNALYEQLPAEEDFGDTYVVLPNRSRSAQTFVRLLAASDNTVFTLNGAPWATLAKRGDVFESWIDAPPAILKGSAPFLAAQYTASGSHDSLQATDGDFYGDPSLAFLVPQSAFAGCHVFFAGPPRYNVNSTPPTAPWDSLFVSFAVFAGAEGSVLLDGLHPSCEFRPVPGGLLSAGAMNIRPGFHKLETSDPRGIFGLSYGFAKFDAYSTTTSRTFTFPKSIVAGAERPQSAGLSLTVSPNPLRAAATIAYALPAASRTRLEIVDALGVVRIVPLDADRSRGEHRAALDASSLTPGRYWLRLVTDRGVLSTQIVVVR